MPLIEKLNHLKKDDRPSKPKVLEPTKAEYYIVEENSAKYLHINTYSKLGKKVDQTIQLSPEAIKQLAKIIVEEYL